MMFAPDCNVTIQRRERTGKRHDTRSPLVHEKCLGFITPITLEGRQSVGLTWDTQSRC
jgi:hypothetical protein